MLPGRVKRLVFDAGAKPEIAKTRHAGGGRTAAFVTDATAEPLPGMVGDAIGLEPVSPIPADAAWPPQNRPRTGRGLVLHGTERREANTPC